MLSKTVRYVKLMYIVAGIVLSQEDICKTVDKIDLVPKVEYKKILKPASVIRLSRHWLEKLDIFGLRKILASLKPISIWSLPQFLLRYPSEMLDNCDMIF